MCISVLIEEFARIKNTIVALATMMKGDKLLNEYYFTLRRLRKKVMAIIK